MHILSPETDLFELVEGKDSVSMINFPERMLPESAEIKTTIWSTAIGHASDNPLRPTLSQCMTKATVRLVQSPISDQPVHPPSGVRIYPSLDSQEAVEGTCDQRRLWSDCVDAQADLRHMPYCRFCLEWHKFCGWYVPYLPQILGQLNSYHTYSKIWIHSLPVYIHVPS